ncbi:MAG: NAD(P)-binding protein [Planctomycetota bacterium]
MPSDYDPFLNSHSVGYRQIDISGRLTPLSIRDQMIRGMLAIDRAKEKGLLDSPSGILVVGAGAAGSTAAMRAAELGFRVSLWDREMAPFTRHGKCSRWVDPSQYDFPVGHWRTYGLPCNPTNTNPCPLPWPAPNEAFSLSSDWRAHVDSYSAIYPQYFQLKLRREYTGIIHTDETNQRVEVGFVDLDNGSQATETFSFVIRAMGFGEERCSLVLGDKSLHPFRGYGFWAKDPFDYSRGTLDWNGNRPRVLISGCGDGALQDYLRLSTRMNTAREIWDAMALSNVPNIDEIIKNLQDAEDQAARSLAWGAGENHDHPVLESLHDAYRMAASEIFNSSNGIEQKIDQMLRDDIESISVAHACEHFSVCYSLNHLLALLVMNRWEARMTGSSSAPSHLPNTLVVGIKCQGHAAGDPSVCHLNINVVRFKKNRTCHQLRDTPAYASIDDRLARRV